MPAVTRILAKATFLGLMVVAGETFGPLQAAEQLRSTDSKAQTHTSPSDRKTAAGVTHRKQTLAATAGNRGISHAPRQSERVASDGRLMSSLRDRLDSQGKLLAEQQQQISKLVATVQELSNLLNRAPSGASTAAIERRSSTNIPAPAMPVATTVMTATSGAPPVAVAAPRPELVASLEPMLAPSPALASLTPTVASTPPVPATPQTSGEQAQPYTTRLDNLSKEVEGISKGIAGFRFSGDFRLRADGIYRTSNSVAGPEQNTRGRYRARLNFDKGIDHQLSAHFQLGSGRFDNALTDDTDFGGGAVRGPIFLSEAWIDYHPNSNLSFRGGKMPEVFQDFTRFIWDEDVRFNGLQESFGKSVSDNLLGITRVSLRTGQYVLTNPNIPVLPSAKQCAAASAPASCVYLQAGYSPGQNVRAADLFDEGIFVDGRIKPGWSQYTYANFISYRNADQIALGSMAAGYGVFANNQLGITLPGPLTGTGSATTLPGGGIFTAHQYQIGHVAYRITKEGWRTRNEEFPVFLDVQASRNFGTGFLRNAWAATLNVGDIKKAGDVRFLYLYAVKDANSMVSEFTDDQVGTQTGVNIRTHAFRFDIGLAKFLQWQNIVYIQNEISPNDPARHFYVPIQQGAGTQFRVQSSLFANF